MFCYRELKKKYAHDSQGLKSIYIYVIFLLHYEQDGKRGVFWPSLLFWALVKVSTGFRLRPCLSKLMEKHGTSFLIIETVKSLLFSDECNFPLQYFTYRHSRSFFSRDRNELQDFILCKNSFVIICCFAC